MGLNKKTTESMVIRAIIDWTWTDGKNSQHDLHNDLLYRINKALEPDYLITGFKVKKNKNKNANHKRTM